jgi:hypothetical protein
MLSTVPSQMIQAVQEKASCLKVTSFGGAANCQGRLDLMLCSARRATRTHDDSVSVTGAAYEHATLDDTLLTIRCAAGISDTPHGRKPDGFSGHPRSLRHEPRRRCPRQWMFLAAFASRSAT